jgi:hypothetical protein
LVCALPDDKLIKEDSIPITTKRSFNSETVTFPATYPMHFNVVLKDYIKTIPDLSILGQTANKSVMGDLSVNLVMLILVISVGVTDGIVEMHRHPYRPTRQCLCRRS